MKLDACRKTRLCSQKERILKTAERGTGRIKQRHQARFGAPKSEARRSWVRFPARGPSACSPCACWVLARFSGFLPQSKNMTARQKLNNHCNITAHTQRESAAGLCVDLLLHQRTYTYSL